MLRIVVNVHVDFVNGWPIIDIKTLSESMNVNSILIELNEKRKACYIKTIDPDYERMVIQQDSSRPKDFMVWAGISSCGKTSLRYVQPGAKINSDYYINNILKSFLSRDVPL